LTTQSKIKDQMLAESISWGLKWVRKYRLISTLVLKKSREFKLNQDKTPSQYFKYIDKDEDGRVSF
jgi:hypothetical protein